MKLERRTILEIFLKSRKEPIYIKTSADDLFELLNDEDFEYFTVKKIDDKKVTIFKNEIAYMNHVK